MALVEYAKLYASELGFNVFPVGPDCRQPLTAHGYKDASADASEIAAMWRGREDANVALACGSLSGVMVVDVDVKGEDGPRSLRALIREHGDLPFSWRADTPSGGSHLFFRQPDRALRNRVGFRPGLDIRTTGGSVCLAPSAKAGSSYSWVRDPLEGTELCDAPAWLLDVIDPPPPPRPPTPPLRIANNDRFLRYVLRALENELARIRCTPPNTGRNQQLFISSAAMGSLGGAGLISLDVIRGHLHAAAADCGLVKDDGLRSVTATIESGLKAGTSRPREVRLG